MPSRTCYVNGLWPIRMSKGEAEGRSKDSFIHWFENHFNGIAVHASTQLWVYGCLSAFKDRPQIRSAVEYFGGIGTTTQIVRNTISPRIEQHTVYEIDDECLHHLKQQEFSGSVDVKSGDAFKRIGAERADLHCCDFFRFSVAQSDKWMKNLSAMFASDPVAVCVTDTAQPYFPVNRPNYARYFGVPLEGMKTQADYFREFSRWFMGRFGYSSRWTAYSSFSGCMMLMKGDQPCEMKKITTRAISR